VEKFAVRAPISPLDLLFLLRFGVSVPVPIDTITSTTMEFSNGDKALQKHRSRRRPEGFLGKHITFCRLVLFFSLQFCQASDRGQGRYSYSLTTFDPSGKLGQVERAMQAAEQGTPIVALIQSNGVIFAAPQVLPPFALDDGTTRFSLVTPEIMVAHSGLSADGRILVAAAQKLAVEHEYTFDENIDIAIFLEELSLLFQEYTMKPAARPFGASLVVAFVPQTELVLNPDPVLYRIDPSGNVESLKACAVVHGSLERTDLREKLQEMSDLQSEASIEVGRAKVVDLLRDALQQQASKKRGEKFDDFTILTATLSRDCGQGCFRRERYETKPDTTEGS
jgi:20S proteasome subunit alpha 2